MRIGIARRASCTSFLDEKWVFSVSRRRESRMVYREWMCDGEMLAFAGKSRLSKEREQRAETRESCRASFLPALWSIKGLPSRA